MLDKRRSGVPARREGGGRLRVLRHYRYVVADNWHRFLDSQPVTRFLKRRSTLLVIGLLLAGIPTAYSIFPEWTNAGVSVRGPILGVWFLAALAAVEAGTHQSALFNELMGRGLEDRVEMREEVAARILERFLCDAPGKLRDYRWRLFVPDPNDPTRLIVPAFAPTQSTTVWPIGQGVTGAAFLRNGGEFAIGDEIATRYPVQADLFDPEQLARHAELKVVAAMPLKSAMNRTLGVLTAHSREELPYITTPDGQKEHSRLADTVTRVLIDMLGSAE